MIRSHNERRTTNAACAHPQAAQTTRPRLGEVVQERLVSARARKLTTVAPTPLSPIERKAKAMVAKLSVQELGWMLDQRCGGLATGPASQGAQDLEALVEKKAGSFLNIAGVELTNKLQAKALASGQPPLLIGVDIIHGAVTTFPINLAQACSGDPSIARRTSAAAGREGKALGINWTFAPMGDVDGPSTWGRVIEGYGESTHLAGKFVAEVVRGFQEDAGMLACIKHLAGYSLGQGWEYNNAKVDRETLYNYVLPVYWAAVDAGVKTGMAAFNDFKETPCHGSEELLTHELREKHGFRGVIVSDWTGIKEQICHGTAADLFEAALWSLYAGVDLDMESRAFSHLAENLEARIEDPELRREIEAKLRQAAERLLTLKMEFFGENFEKYEPASLENVEKIVGCQEHLDLALEAAHKSIVLLKNEGGVLPLKPGMKKIGLVGPLADSKADCLGAWAMMGNAERPVSVKEAFLERSRTTPGFEDLQVVYEKGCETDIVRNRMLACCEAFEASRGAEKGSIFWDASVAKVGFEARENMRRFLIDDPQLVKAFVEFEKSFAYETRERGSIERAVALLDDPAIDVVVAVIGEPAAYSGEANSRTSLDPTGNQRQLLQELHAKAESMGKEVVLVLMHGHPLTIPWEAEHLNAIVDTWQLGDRHGDATWDVLSGAYNPGGFLADSLPRSVASDPLVHHQRKNSGRPAEGPDGDLTTADAEGHYVRSWRDEIPGALFPFGHQQSYTTFDYSAVRVSKSKLREDDTVDISVLITNSGDRRGDHVVQLYVHDDQRAKTQPLQDLKGFERVSLEPGESREVSFTIQPGRDLTYQVENKQGKMVPILEPGTFTVRVGRDSEDKRNLGRFEVVGPNPLHIPWRGKISQPST